jgi:hypothetical protein
MYNSNNENYRSEFESGYSQESPYELSPEFEFNSQSNMEYSNEYSNEYSGEAEFELSPEFETTNQYENYEAAFANELMQVTNEFEFGDWLKGLVKTVAAPALGFVNSLGGKQLVSTLGNIAQKTIPGLGQLIGGLPGQIGRPPMGPFGGPLQAIGSVAGMPGAGFQPGLVGAQAAAQAALAKAQAAAKAGQTAVVRAPSFVRFATDAIKNVANDINNGQAPQITPAIVKSATQHYPIILKVKGTLYAKTMRNPNYNPSSHEFEFENSNEAYQGESNNENALNEINEMELASELLSVKNDNELDMFLGNLFKKVTGAVSNFAKSGAGSALAGMLKRVAGKAMPALGGILGTAIPIPGVGTMLGSSLGNAARNLFGLELEGLSGEDREFETARAFIRLAGDAAKRGSQIRNMAPFQAARLALIRSAKNHAPGLIRLRRNNAYGNYPRYGNFRRNRNFYPRYGYGNPSYGYGYPANDYPNDYPQGVGAGGSADTGADDMDMLSGSMDPNGGNPDANPEIGMYEGNW